MKREPKGKFIIVGVDGMDASLCKKFLDEGKMPNVKKLLEQGSAREDLVMLAHCRLSPRRSGQLWRPALIPAPTASPASGTSILKNWIPWSIRWIPATAALSSCGT